MTWQQRAGSDPPVGWTYGYDTADQLTRAVKQTTDPVPVVLQRFAYGYDPAGNRVFEQIDDAVTSWTYDALNRLVTQQGGGVLRFAGTVSEPATVTVAGQPASVSSANAFEAGVPVVVGTNPVAITATDPSGNTATATYEVDVAEAAKKFTYDANGNLTSDGARTFEWDARNQLVAARQRSRLAGSQTTVTTLPARFTVAASGYVNNRPVVLVDDLGTAPKGTQTRDCTRSGSTCETYQRCDSYAGANAKCFCRCAGDDPWAQSVRCCLVDYREAGYSMEEAHLVCCALGTAKHPLSIPGNDLGNCWWLCRRTQAYSCGC